MGSKIGPSRSNSSSAQHRLHKHERVQHTRRVRGEGCKRTIYILRGGKKGEVRTVVTAVVRFDFKRKAFYRHHCRNGRRSLPFDYGNK